MTHQTPPAGIIIHGNVIAEYKTPLRQLIERRQEMPRRLITLEDPPEGRILCMPLPEEPADEN
ncbi:hypothetical protein D3C79_144150 [compost metagenome]